jgi:hypothetical protein
MGHDDPSARHRRDPRRERREARDREHREPDRGAAERGDRRERKRDTARGRDHLPPFREAEVHGARVPGHRGGAREHADPVAAEPEPDGGRHEPLGDVQDGHGKPQRPAVDPPDVRRADVAAPVPADVVAVHEPWQDVAEGNRAQDVGRRDESRVGDHHTRRAGPSNRARGAALRPKCRTTRSIR